MKVEQRWTWSKTFAHFSDEVKCGVAFYTLGNGGETCIVWQSVRVAGSSCTTCRLSVSTTSCHVRDP